MEGDDDEYDSMSELLNIEQHIPKGVDVPPVVKSSNPRRKVEKITKDTFYGEEKTDNAVIFVESLEKTR
jgi:hypothetical protein